MKAWKTLLFVGLGALVAAGCTVEVSEGDGEDDDLMADEQRDFDEDDLDDDSDDDDTTADDPGDDDMTDDEMVDDDSTADDPTDDDATDDTSPEAGADDSSTDDMTDDSSTDDMTDDTSPEAGADDDMTDDDMTDDMTTVDDSTNGGECTLPDTEGDDCETCMQMDCATVHADCSCDEDCSSQFATLRSCIADRLGEDGISEDAAGDFDFCFGVATMEGTSSELEEALYCANASFVPMSGEGADGGTGEDPLGRFEGDGTCTFACYGLYNVN